MGDAVHISSGLLSSARKVIRSPHFWAVLAIFAIGVILHYPEQLIPWGASAISSFLGTTRHTAERVFFLIPITYASFIFGLKGGIASLVAAGFIMMPRAISISLVPADAILESSGVIIVGGVVNLWFYMHRKNIAQRRSIEEALVRIIDGSSIPSFVINKQHKVTHWNTAIEALTGIKREEIIGTDEQWRAFYHEKRPIMADLIVDGASEDEIATYYKNGYKKSQLIDGAYEAEDWFSAPGKDRQCHHFTASPIRNHGGEITGAIETLENITERRKAEENLRYYLQEITKAQEEERKRIARELHDSSAQNLIALLHQLDNLLTDKTKLPVSEAKALWGFYEQIRDTLQEVRRFSRDLRPSILDDLGLLPALEWVTEDLKSTYWIEVDLKVLGNERRLFPETELLLFRIVQEALRNIAKHAEATRAEVEVKFDEDKITITVSDNGKGFEPPESFGALTPTGKLGLAGMQERVQLLGGRLKLESEPGKGTKIFVEAPV
jgi:two-component system sensor histidine kinase DegS